MPIHNYNSWGRTRGPKNVAGPPGTKVVLTSTTNLKTSNADYKDEGYSTESQRYLHILIEDTNEDNTPGTISIYGYNHAFQKWVEISQTQLDSANTSGGASAVVQTQSAANAAPLAQVPSDRTYRLYEIAGIDRVAFTSSQAATRVNVWAATSTF